MAVVMLGTMAVVMLGTMAVVMLGTMRPTLGPTRPTPGTTRPTPGTARPTLATLARYTIARRLNYLLDLATAAKGLIRLERICTARRHACFFVKEETFLFFKWSG
jgi:hypothetical protein